VPERNKLNCDVDHWHMPPDYAAIIGLVSSDNYHSIQLPGQTHSVNKQASLINKQLKFYNCHDIEFKTFPKKLSNLRLFKALKMKGLNLRFFKTLYEPCNIYI
jgi:hypothetical protein